MPASPAAAWIVVSANNSRIAAAHAADVRHCKEYIEVFDAQHAAVDEAREYGRCINVVYPRPPSDETGMRVFIGVELFAALIGAIIGARSGFDTGDAWLIGCFGAIIAIIVPPTILGIVFAIAFVFGVRA